MENTRRQCIEALLPRPSDRVGAFTAEAAVVPAQVETKPPA